MNIPTFSRTHRAVAGVFGAVVAGALLTACGSNGGSSTTTTTATTIAPPGSSNAVSTTSTAVATCSTGALTISSASSGGAAGTSSFALTAKNNGSTPCALDGYPSLTFFGPSPAGGAGAGPKLPLTVEQTGSAPSSVTLAANGTAQFTLIITDVPVNGAGCSEVASVNVTPPGSDESIPTPESFSPCGTTVQVTAFTSSS